MNRRNAHKMSIPVLLLFLLFGAMPGEAQESRALQPEWWFGGSVGLNVNFYFGGTSLLIVVGVAMDTVQQVESQLIMRHYDGFMKKTRIRGRRA